MSGLVGVVRRRLFEDPKLATQISAAPITLLILFSVVVLTAIPASCCPPAYPHGEDIAEDELLLTPEEEAAMMAANQPLNNYCVVGTHNSCHVCSLFGWFFIKEWQYTHSRCTQQFDYGIRHLEFDVWYNRGLQRWEIWHEIVDCLSSAPLLFEDGLRLVNCWSAEHPDHFPLCINLDIKGSYIPCTSLLVPFPMGRGLGDQGYGHSASTEDVLQELDRTIRSVWGEEPATQILEPSWFTKDNAVSVAAAVAEKGWPKKGYCFFDRNHGEDHVHIYYETTSNLPELRRRNCLVRGFVSPEGVKHGKTPMLLAKQGLHLVATDHPGLLGCRGVFLPDESADVTIEGDGEYYDDANVVCTL